MAERSVIIRLKGDISDFQSKMKTAGQTAKNALGREIDGLTKRADLEKKLAAETSSEGRKRLREELAAYDKRHQALNDLGNAAGKVGLAAAAGFGIAVGAAANFDEAMSHVSATGEDARANIDALREAALEAGAATAFSATEAAAGLEALAKAGVAAEDALAGGLQGSLDLAAAGTIGVQEAAEAAATAMTQFGLSGADVPHIADLLAAGAGKAQGEVSDMNYALAQSGLVANAMGLSIEETTGGLAAFAAAGLLGSDAGTSFKTMLGALTPNSAKASDKMNELGLSAFDAQGEFIGLAEYAGKLQHALGGMSTEQRRATLETIFGQDAVRAATELYNQGEDGIRHWVAAVDDQGYAAETAAEKMNNLKGDLEELKGSLETAFIGAGDGAQGPLRGLTQGATDAVNAFANLPPAAQDITTAMLGITAITGGGLWFGTKVVSGIADTKRAMDDLNISAGRLKGSLGSIARGGAVLAVASLAAELRNLQLQANSMDVTGLSRDLAILGESGDVTGELADAFGSDLAGAAKNFRRDGESLAETLEYVAYAAGSTTEQIENFLDGGSAEVERVKELDDALASLAGTNAPAAEQAFAALTDIAEEQGVSVDKLLAVFPQYAKEIERSAVEADAAGDAQEGFADGMSEAAQAAQAEADALADSVIAMRDKREAALEALDAELGYAQALLDANERVNKRKELIKDLAQAEADLANADTKDERDAARDRIADLKEELADYTRTLDLSTQAGVDNMTTLADMAEAWNNQDDAAKNAKGSYKAARKALIDTAMDFGATKAEAKKYADELLEIPTRVQTKVALDSAAARDALGAFRADLSALPKSVKVKVLAHYEGLIDDRKGPVGKGEWAEGGYTGPGPKYQPAGIVHAGEVVWSQSDVARAGGVSVVETMRLRGYADGGPVGFASRPGSGWAGGMGGIDYDRLTEAVLRARPLYGPVSVQPHNYSEFERQITQDRQLAGLDGVSR